MKRCIVGISILLSLVVLCAGSLLVLHREARSLAAETQQLAEMVNTIETETVLTAYDALLEKWERFHDVAGIFVEGEKLDVIRRSLAGLRPMLKAGLPDALAELARIRELAEDVFREELPDIWHIL